MTMLWFLDSEEKVKYSALVTEASSNLITILGSTQRTMTQCMIGVILFVFENVVYLVYLRELLLFLVFLSIY